jgi:hypothetical protein
LGVESITIPDKLGSESLFWLAFSDFSKATNDEVAAIGSLVDERVTEMITDEQVARQIQEGVGRADEYRALVAAAEHIDLVYGTRTGYTRAHVGFEDSVMPVEYKPPEVY